MYENSNESWADWMVVTLSLEQQLLVEAGARELKQEKSKEELLDIAVAFHKQCFVQSQLIKNCVDKIAELEAVNTCNEIREERSKKPGFFQFLLRREVPNQSQSSQG